MKRLALFFSLLFFLVQALDAAVLCGCGQCPVSKALGIGADDGDDTAPVHLCCAHRRQQEAQAARMHDAIAPDSHHCSHAPSTLSAVGNDYSAALDHHLTSADAFGHVGLPWSHRIPPRESAQNRSALARAPPLIAPTAIPTATIRLLI